MSQQAQLLCIKKEKLLQHITERPLSNTQFPLLDSFRKEEQHDLLLQRALQVPSTANFEALDEAFRHHYTKRRFLQYVSKSIHWEAVDFDRKHRKRDGIFPLLLEQPQEEANETMRDQIEDPSQQVEDQAIAFTVERLEDVFHDPLLRKSIATLTPLQKKILIALYYLGYSMKETAAILRTSHQNISKSHRRILQQLQAYREES